MRSYKFRIYPNDEQTEKLYFALDITRKAYNYFLQQLREQTEIDRKKIQASIVDLKVVKPEFREVYSKVLQYECYKLFSNLKALSRLKTNGKKVGRLRFKGRRWFKTLTYNQSGFALIETQKRFSVLKLSKIGDIKLRQHRAIEGNIKQITIKRYASGWYAILQTDVSIKTKCGIRQIGIDLGTKNFIADSEGSLIEHPHNTAKYGLELKKAQQSLSRKKKGSNNRGKAIVKVAKIHEKINNNRDDFLHKVSTNYIRKCKLIAVEDLNIKRIIEKSWNAKYIMDASWDKFIRMLQYKAESADAEVVKVNPENTTQRCSGCNKIVEKKLWNRIHKCPYCSLELDRDVNSAINILKLGLGQTHVERFPSVLLEQGNSGKQEAMSLSENDRA